MASKISINGPSHFLLFFISSSYFILFFFYIFFPTRITASHTDAAANLPPPRRVLTGDNRRYAPAHGVVEPDVAVVDVPHFRQHAVDVQPLHEHPRKGAHVEVVEEDGDDGADKLEGDEDTK